MKHYPILPKRKHTLSLCWPSTPAAPVCTEECFACGECIEVCPTHAIALSDEGKIETEITKCIKCCACVKECPNGARVFDTPYTPCYTKNVRHAVNLNYLYNE